MTQMIYRAICIDEKNKFFNSPAERQLYNKSAFRQEEFKKEILPIQKRILWPNVRIVFLLPFLSMLDEISVFKDRFRRKGIADYLISVKTWCHLSVASMRYAGWVLCI